MKQRIIICLLISLVSISCKNHNIKKDPSVKEDDATYFSIKQFIMDEWTTYQGLPFTIVKNSKIDGKSDSSFTNSDTLNWAPLFQIFFETDISDKKFLNKYEFSQFDDNSDNSHSFYYQAKDDDLFTRKLLISIDRDSRKINGIYVETKTSSLLGAKVQKLYYAPMKTIQIQQYSYPLIGAKKEMVTEYNFMM